MEVSALTHRAQLRGPTPLLRLQGDERLVALTRRGNQAAYEILVGRYQARLLAFCRHMLSSREDAEDVLQEVFAAAFNALLADDRPINVRPWLYRIARNRSLNHLRRTQAIGVDSMDVHYADHGASTADRVHKREDFRQLIGDVQELPETQRTALLLREIDALSYEQIADAMETTVPSVKSLLVRARVSLAEAAEARRLTCEEVRDELGEVAEGLRRKSPPARRHVRQCERCAAFDKQLRSTNRALAAVFPVGPLLLLKKFLIAQGGSAAATAGAGAASAGAGAGSALTAGVGAVATKTAAGLAAAAIVTAGAVEVDHVRGHPAPRAVSAQVAAPAKALPAPAPRVIVTTPQPAHTLAGPSTELAAPPARDAKPAGTKERTAPPKPGGAVPDGLPVPVAGAPGARVPAVAPIGAPQTGEDTTTLPGRPVAPALGVGVPASAPPQPPAAPASPPAASIIPQSTATPPAPGTAPEPAPVPSTATPPAPGTGAEPPPPPPAAPRPPADPPPPPAGAAPPAGPAAAPPAS